MSSNSSDVSIAGGAHVGGRDAGLLPTEMPYDIVTRGSDLRVGIGSSERGYQVVAPGRPDLGLCVPKTLSELMARWNRLKLAE